MATVAVKGLKHSAVSWPHGLGLGYIFILTFIVLPSKWFLQTAVFSAWPWRQQALVHMYVRL